MKILKEAFSPSMPDWLKNTVIDSRKRKLSRWEELFDKVDFTSAVFKECEIPETARQADCMKYPNLAFILLQNGGVMWRSLGAPYGEVPETMGYSIYGYDANNISYVKLKPAIKAICYIDLNDIKSLTGGLTATRKNAKDRMDNRQNRYNGDKIAYTSVRNASTPWGKPADPFSRDNEYWLDKSGYIIDPERYKAALEDKGLEKVADRLEEYHDKLISLQRNIVSAVNSISIPDTKRASEINFSNAINEFAQACSYYNTLVERTDANSSNKDALRDIWLGKYSSRAYLDLALKSLTDKLREYNKVHYTW